MSDPTTIPALLRLPREIRDSIYDYLLDVWQDPPPNPSFPGQRIQARNSSQINYPMVSLRCGYIGLSCTNNQLRAEILELTNKRLTSGGCTAELDLQCKGYRSWPTWTCFPWYAHPAWRRTIRKNLDSDVERDQRSNINVNLRIFSTEGFRSNDGWPRQPGSTLRDLFKLLQHFIEFGPDFGQTFRYSKTINRVKTPRMEPEWLTYSNSLEIQERQLFRIDTLSVNIEFHDIYSRATHPGTAHTIFKALKELAISGFFRHRLRSIRAHATFAERGEDTEWKNEWEVPTSPDPRILSRWHEWGFITFGEEEYHLWSTVR